MIIGVTGYKGSGKDTVARYLCENYDFQQVSFAEPMKNVLCYIFGWNMSQWESLEWKETPNEACYGHTPRHIAQTFGTGWGRDVVHNNLWVDTLARQLHPDGRYVISDVRFDNEAAAVRALGGAVVRVKVRGRVQADGHASEAGVSDMHVGYEAEVPYGSTGILCDAVCRYVNTFAYPGQLRELSTAEKLSARAVLKKAGLLRHKRPSVPKPRRK